MLKPAMPDRDWIAAHIPHQDSMCLLDAVMDWDSARIQCRASSHRTTDNPLRAYGRLGAACGIEYAAQAMAVHGALMAESLAPADSMAPRAGYLVSARGVELHTTRLDDITEDLIIEASCSMSNANNMLYEFKVSTAQRMLLQGRATVVLNVDTLFSGGMP